MKPISLEQAIQIAQACYASKSYRQVKQILRRIIQHGAQNADIYLLMGNTNYCLSEYEQAIDAYLHGLQIKPDFADLHANLGNAYVRLQAYEAAIDSYGNAVTYQPNFAEVYKNLIYVYSITQQIDKAIQVCGVLDSSCDSNSLEIALNSKYSRQNPSFAYLSFISVYNKWHIDGHLENRITSENMYAGRSLVPWIFVIKKLVALTNSQTLLDYGSGKGCQYRRMLLEDKEKFRYQNLQAYWAVDEIYCYDPGYPLYSKLPTKQYDAVISTDVLEHCHQEDIMWIIDEIFSLSKKFVFASIACYQAKKSFPNGKNVHCTIRPAGWWDMILQSVTIDHPKVKYCIIVEYAWNDIGENGQVFQILSNFDSSEMELDSPAITILEADKNIVPYVPYKVGKRQLWAN